MNVELSECFPLSKIMLSQLKYMQVHVKWALSPNYSKSICTTSQWYSVVFYHHQIFRLECTAFTKPGDRERQSECLGYVMKFTALRRISLLP